MPIWWILFAVVMPVGSDSRIDFDHDVIPVLTKAGCNTGACHGAAIGRGGFKLSLYGGDPVADYRAIALELKGRRVNLIDPDQSLLLMKPTEATEHGGGYRLDPDSSAVARVTEWIRHGAHRGDRAAIRRFVRLEVSPQSAVIRGSGGHLTLKAVAHFSDGLSRDVTGETVFKAEDPAALEVDSETAKTRVLRGGRHIIIARYLSQVMPIEIIQPYSDRPSGVTRGGGQTQFVDRSVDTLLATLGIPASGAVDDASFLRRVSLDLTGRLPEPGSVRSFLADRDPERRVKLIDRLLASEAFNEYWTLQLAKLLRIHAQPGNLLGVEKYHAWLKQQISEKVGYDVVARSVLTAQGDTHQIGPANFFRTVGGPREQAEFTSELFMGSRLRCANCHNHPLDQWTQDDYHGLAAIFARVQQGQVVAVASGGQVIHPRTGENAVPRIPGEHFLEDSDDPREALADWLISSDNPYFARAMVNRLWKAMMGRGLVEPADDLRATNPATHPKLLKTLAEDFVAHQFDLRHTLRLIASSDAYSRSSRTVSGNEIDDRYYSHRMPQSLEPEVLADAISDVLEVSERYGDTALGTRAVTLVDPGIESQTLDVLGRCSRQDTCETPVLVQDNGGLSRKLHLFNGPLLNQRIASNRGRLSRLLESGATVEVVVDEFYLAALGRPVSDGEKRFWNERLKSLADPTEKREQLEDFVWGLLTCKEFVTNH